MLAENSNFPVAGALPDENFEHGRNKWMTVIVQMTVGAKSVLGTSLSAFGSPARRAGAYRYVSTRAPKSTGRASQQVFAILFAAAVVFS